MKYADVNAFTQLIQGFQLPFVNVNPYKMCECNFITLSPFSVTVLFLWLICPVAGVGCDTYCWQSGRTLHFLSQPEGHSRRWEDLDPFLAQD